MGNSIPASSGDEVPDSDPRQDRDPERSAEDPGHQSAATTTPAEHGSVRKTWTKTDLVNELAAIHGYHSYLEICTPTTGKLYATVDRDRYTNCHRLMYRCPDKFDDGFPIDFRSSGLDIERHLRVIRAVERKVRRHPGRSVSRVRDDDPRSEGGLRAPSTQRNDPRP